MLNHFLTQNNFWKGVFCNFGLPRSEVFPWRIYLSMIITPFGAASKHARPRDWYDILHNLPLVANESHISTPHQKLLFLLFFCRLNAIIYHHRPLMTGKEMWRASKSSNRQPSARYVSYLEFPSLEDLAGEICKKLFFFCKLLLKSLVHRSAAV